MSEVTNLEKIRKLPWQLGGNAANMIFWVTAAYGSVFILFLNEIGFDKAKIGFLMSLLPFCGPLALVVAPFAAHFGFKRTFLIFYLSRKFCAALLLLTPFILSRFGQDVTFFWVTGAVLGFAVCRAISETAVYPWSQEMVPDAMRGKFSAVNNIVSTIVSIITIGIAGYAIRRWEGLPTFMVLMGCGIVAGFVSVWCFTSVPGGDPAQHSQSNRAHFRGIRQALLDLNYRRFIIGLGLISFAATALVTFVPLYLKEKIGLSAGMVVWMDIGTFAGGLLSCYLWGWAADRYGSKPIMLLGCCLWVLFPAVCFLMPRNTEMSSLVAICAMFLMGVANLAWAIGLTRYLFVTAVPVAKKTTYMAVFYAFAGISNGLGPLSIGWLLKKFNWLDTQILIFNIDSYTILFVLSVGILCAGTAVLSRVRSDGAMAVRRFVGMFLQGNPITAAGTIFRYYRATDEEDRVSITERMGYANNPLSNNELIEALNDPSFNVRYEAIIAIAHRRPDPELVDALLLALGGNEPDLSTHAAWALGRLGDKSAAIALRETLESEHPLLRARSARALATLGDTHSIPRVLHHFRTETKPGLRIAFAQGLGKMRSAIAINEILDFLASLEDESLRQETALAVARIAGGEKEYIWLWRELKHDKNTVVAQAILAMKRDFNFLPENGKDLAAMIRQCSKTFADGDISNGIGLLALLIKRLPFDKIGAPLGIILIDCTQKLEAFGPARSEYLLLSIHTLERAIRNLHNGTSQSERQLPAHSPLIAHR